MKNHHISEAGVSFEIQFGLFIKIWAGEHIFYVWQETVAVSELFIIFGDHSSWPTEMNDN